MGTHVLLPRNRPICQGTPRQHFGPAERAQIHPQGGERAQINRNETKRDGNSPTAPAPVQHAKGKTRQHFVPAERAQIQPQGGERAQIQPQRGKRAQIKRNQTKRDGNSRTAPPNPSNMPRDKHVRILAPLSAPKSNRRGKVCPNQTKRNETGWELTACPPAPVQHANGKNTSALWPR